MGVNYFDSEDFDLKLAIDCAKSYSSATDLGCTISNVSGKVLYVAGHSFDQCNLCKLAGLDSISCDQVQAYGLSAAERFGGKYIYFCPMGLTSFVSPILSETRSAAKITVGPFLMVEREDFVAYELDQLLSLSAEIQEKLSRHLEDIPYVPPDKVTAYSNLLFMSVSFINNVSAANRMLEHQNMEELQGQISQYILDLKQGEDPPRYPLETERELLSSISFSDRPKAQRLLNELLGYIFFASGDDFSLIKARTYDLTVLISRSAIDAGASVEEAFRLTQRFFSAIQKVADLDSLSLELSKVMNAFIDSVFKVSTAKNLDVMQKALQYMWQNSAQRLTLESAAQHIHLSASYFGKMFKRETGYNFNAYLNNLRIEQSKKLLAFHHDIPLIDIASAVGFEDQSYFTKVFKRVTGTSPNQYRKNGGKPRAKSELE
ncbi:MAG TPA: helix-turn-helix domain-containing protein [Anaerovoracaceae bacterium]|nr:helix-turn-helix domain-containing protein [Anaerovoracaceae bacterium]